jgi:hypothetical protein
LRQNRDSLLHQWRQLQVFLEFSRMGGTMEIHPIASHSAVLLAGILIGAAGEYFALLFTDKRHRREQVKSERLTFQSVRAMMPKLIQEMRDDVKTQPLARDFRLVDDRSIVTGSVGMAYYADEHDDLERACQGVAESSIRPACRRWWRVRIPDISNDRAFRRTAARDVTRCDASAARANCCGRTDHGTAAIGVRLQVCIVQA